MKLFKLPNVTLITNVIIPMTKSMPIMVLIRGWTIIITFLALIKLIFLLLGMVDSLRYSKPLFHQKTYPNLSLLKKSST